MTRWQVPIVLAAVAIGTAIGLLLDLGDAPETLVVPALIGLLAITFAGVNGRAVTTGIRPHPAVAAASLGINFVWTPLLAGGLGWLLLSSEPDLRLGLVMLLVTPCTDWYLVFTGTARGNVALAASLLPPNLILQLLLLPVFVTALTGTAADIPLGDLAGSVALVLGIPLAIAALVRFVAARTNAHDRLDRTLERAQPVGLALLAIAIAAIFATHARVVTDNPDAFLRLLAPPRRLLRPQLPDRRSHRSYPRAPARRARHPHHDHPGPQLPGRARHRHRRLPRPPPRRRRPRRRPTRRAPRPRAHRQPTSSAAAHHRRPLSGASDSRSSAHTWR